MECRPPEPHEQCASAGVASTWQCSHSRNMVSVHILFWAFRSYLGLRSPADGSLERSVNDKMYAIAQLCIDFEALRVVTFASQRES